MRDSFSFPLPDETADAVSGKDIATVTGNEPEVSEFPDSRSTSAFTGTDIIPDPEVGDPPDGGIKRVPPLASGSELGFEVGEPPGCSGGCTPLAFGHKADPSNGQAYRRSPTPMGHGELLPPRGRPPYGSRALDR